MRMRELAVNSSEVRSRFSEEIDTVLHKKPRIVARNRDQFVMMNFDHVSALTDGLRLSVQINADSDGSFVASCSEIDDLVASGESSEEAIKALVAELIEYSYEYLRDNFELYFRAPNRRKHFPYVFKIMMQESEENVLRFVDVKH